MKLLVRGRPSKVAALVGCGALALAILAVSSQARSVGPPSRAQLISAVPALDRIQYSHYPYSILPSAYGASFQRSAKPWKFCFSDAYEGNPWRVRGRKVAELMVSSWQKVGLSKEPLFTAVPNGNVATQINQIRSMIDRGCNAIVAYLASTKGFNSVIKQAYDKGIVFVSIDADPGSPYAQVTGSNWYVVGAQLAQAVVDALPGKGNVVMQDGIAGTPVAVAENQGAHDVFKKYPGVKVVAEVNGDWTPSVGKSSMLNVLATHPQKIDGVWATGQTSNAIGDAFLQMHRPLPKIIEGSASGYEMGWWHEHFKQVSEVHAAIVPELELHQGFRVALRILEGQRPKLNTILQNVPLVTSKNFSQWWRPCMTPQATSTYPLPPKDPQPENVLNQFFFNGKNTPPYNYTNANLNPCGA